MICLVSRLNFLTHSYLYYSDRPRGKKSKNKSTSSASGQSEHEIRSCDGGHSCADSTGCLRQRKFSSKAALNRRRSGSTVSSGTLLTDKKLMDKSDEADDETDDDTRYPKIKETPNPNEMCSRHVLHHKTQEQPPLWLHTVSRVKGSMNDSDSELKDELKLLEREKPKSGQNFDKVKAKSNPDLSISASHVQNNMFETFSGDIAPCSLDDSELFNGFTEATGEVTKETSILETNTEYPCSLADIEHLGASDPIGETDKDSGVTTKNDTDSNSETSHILEAAPYQALGHQASRWGTIVQEVNDLNGSLSTHANNAKEHNLTDEGCHHKISPINLTERETKSVTFPKRKPSSLNLRCSQLKEESVGLSSCDSEGDATTPQTPKVIQYTVINIPLL